MTDADRITALETRLAAAEAVTSLFRRGVSDDARVPYLMLDARLGILTEYWSRKPFGQGAALSIGTAIDRYALYAEIDEESCPDHPSVAVFASCVPRSVYGQPHIAVEGVAGNAPDLGGISRNYGLALTWAERAMFLQREGIQMSGEMREFWLGRLAAPKRLWP